MGRKPRLHVTLITVRTIEQGVGKEQGKSSKEYLDSVSVCYVDSEDMTRFRIKEETSILISTEFGSVVVRALKSMRGPHAGLVFVPYGPWANAVVNPETDNIGMPSLKGISAEVELAPDRPVLSVNELLKQEFGK